MKANLSNQEKIDLEKGFCYVYSLDAEDRLYSLFKANLPKKLLPDIQRRGEKSLKTVLKEFLIFSFIVRIPVARANKDENLLFFYFNKVVNYLEDELPMSRTDRVQLFKEVEKIIFDPVFSLSFREAFLSISIKLLQLYGRPKMRLDNLEVDWRPYYDMIMGHFHLTNASLTLPIDAPIGSKLFIIKFVALVPLVRDYFKDGCYKEMIKVFVPYLTPTENATHERYLLLLAMFLPTHNPHEVKEWYMDIIQHFLLFKKRGVLNFVLFHLLARISQDAVLSCQPHVLKWEETFLSEIFNSFLQNLDLPIFNEMHPSSAAAYGLSAENILLLPDSYSGVLDIDVIGQMAKFVVYTMFETTKTFSYLTQFLRSVESFYHPSNHGSWTTPLGAFVRHITSCFAARYGRERIGQVYPECKDPQKYLINKSDLGFLELLLPLSRWSLFSKSPVASICGIKGLRNLAGVYPEEVIPQLLDDVVTGLTRTNEAHLVFSGLDLLSEIAPFAFNLDTFKPGTEHIVKILELCLPGLDANSEPKTYRTLNFYSSIWQNIAIQNVNDVKKNNGNKKSPIGCSEMKSDENLSNMEKIIRKCVNDEDGNLFDIVVKRSTKEESLENAKEAAHSFEDVALKFLDRIIKLLENSDALQSNLPALSKCTVAFWSSLSVEVYGKCARKYIEAVFDKGINSSGEDWDVVLYSCVSAHPHLFAKLFIIPCFNKFVSELKDEALSHTSKFDNIKPKLSRRGSLSQASIEEIHTSKAYTFSHQKNLTVWYTSLFNAVVMGLNGDFLKDYIHPIVIVGQLCLGYHEQSVVNTGYRLMRSVLYCLTDAYALNLSPFPEMQLDIISEVELKQLKKQDADRIEDIFTYEQHLKEQYDKKAKNWKHWGEWYNYGIRELETIFKTNPYWHDTNLGSIDAQIKWHVPSKENYRLAEDIFFEFLQQPPRYSEKALKELRANPEWTEEMDSWGCLKILEFVVWNSREFKKSINEDEIYSKFFSSKKAVLNEEARKAFTRPPPDFLFLPPYVIESAIRTFSSIISGAINVLGDFEGGEIEPYLVREEDIDPRFKEGITEEEFKNDTRKSSVERWVTPEYLYEIKEKSMSDQKTLISYREYSLELMHGIYEALRLKKHHEKILSEYKKRDKPDVESKIEEEPQKEKEKIEEEEEEIDMDPVVAQIAKLMKENPEEFENFDLEAAKAQIVEKQEEKEEIGGLLERRKKAAGAKKEKEQSGINKIQKYRSELSKSKLTRKSSVMFAGTGESPLLGGGEVRILVEWVECVTWLLTSHCINLAEWNLIMNDINGQWHALYEYNLAARRQIRNLVVQKHDYYLSLRRTTSYSKLTKTVDTLFDDLEALSMHSSQMIADIASDLVLSSMNRFGEVRRMMKVIHKMLDVMNDPLSNTDSVMGAIYILSHSGLIAFIVANFSLFKETVIAILNGQQHVGAEDEKLQKSILLLYESLISTAKKMPIGGHIPRLSSKIMKSESAVQEKIFHNISQITKRDKIEFSKFLCEEYLEKKKVVESLPPTKLDGEPILDVVSEGVTIMEMVKSTYIHARYKLMIGVLLTYLLIPDHPPSIKVVEHIVDGFLLQPLESNQFEVKGLDVISSSSYFQVGIRSLLVIFSTYVPMFQFTEPEDEKEDEKKKQDEEKLKEASVYEGLVDGWDRRYKCETTNFEKKLRFKIFGQDPQKKKISVEIARYISASLGTSMNYILTMIKSNHPELQAVENAQEGATSVTISESTGEAIAKDIHLDWYHLVAGVE